MVTVGLLVTLQAKPGKEGELAAFLAGALPLAQAEPETTSWFAIKIDASTFGIVDVSRTPRAVRPIWMAPSPLRWCSERMSCLRRPPTSSRSMCWRPNCQRDLTVRGSLLEPAVSPAGIDQCLVTDRGPDS